jgi:hypothetical protein
VADLTGVPGIGIGPASDWSDPVRADGGIRSTRDSRVDRVARCISHALSPPSVATVGAFAAATFDSSTRAWWAASIYVVLAVVGPMAVLCRLLGRGRVSDLDLTRREERPIPLLASLGGASLAAGMLSLINAPETLRGLAMAHACVVGAVLLINRYWKVSLHTAGATGVTIIVGALSGWGGIVTVPALLVGWARIRLRRHSVAQVVAGGLVGAMLYLLFASPR